MPERVFLSGVFMNSESNAMRPFEILVLLANLLAFVALASPMFRPVRWMRVLAPVALLVAVTQLLMEGLRWQMVPAYALAVLFFLLWLLHHTSSETLGAAHKRVRRLAVGAGILSLTVAAALPAVFPVFRFPAPSGPHGIGTLSYQWLDASRQEVFSADASARRELMVQVWYPAAKDVSSPRAPYLADANAIAPVLARLLNLPERTLQHLKFVTTNAVLSAPVSAEKQSYPVLIFLEGLSGFRQMNTFQVEALVSHGYIVVAIDQPYTAASVVFPDGRQLNGLSKAKIDHLIQQSVRPAKQAPVLQGRAYEQGIIPYLTQDAILTLDQLSALNRADPQGILTGRLDLERVGIFGISLGAIVAGEACRSDPRWRACLMMDAPMPAAVVKSGLQQPGMWFTRDAKTMQLEGWAQADITQTRTTMREAFERSAPASAYFIQVAGMFHANLTDIANWSPLLPWLGVTGPIGGQRAHDLVNAYSLAFFDRYLKGSSATLLEDFTTQYPEVLFETRGP